MGVAFFILLYLSSPQQPLKRALTLSRQWHISVDSEIRAQAVRGSIGGVSVSPWRATHLSSFIFRRTVITAVGPFD
jgi:hypothetical protein